VTKPGGPGRARGRTPRPSEQAKAGDGAEKREPLTRQKLEQLALTYLNRFDVTASKLKRHLTERARKAGAGDEAGRWIA